MHRLTAPSTTGGRGDRASVLLLMPVAILIVLMLGAIAVDASVVYLRQRQAYNVAFDAANDAAGAGIDLAVARDTGELAYDPVAVARVAADAVAASGIEDLVLVSATTEGDAVVVTVTVGVEGLLAPAFGAPARDEVTITARAEGVLAP